MDKTTQTNDPVHHPPHYQRGGLECKDAMAAMLTPDQLVGYWYGCSIKYLFRWPAKHKTVDGKIDDIRKAQECLGLMAEALESRRDEAQERVEGLRRELGPKGEPDAKRYAELAADATAESKELQEAARYYHAKAEEAHYQEALEAARKERGGHE